MRPFPVISALCGGAAAIGIGLAAWGWSLPVYQVEYSRARAAFEVWCASEMRVDHSAGDRYLALFGWHYALIDTGTALTLGAATIAMLAYVLCLGMQPDKPWLRTPSHRGAWLLIGLGVIGWSYAASVVSFGTDLRRQMFPSCADSIGIPIGGLTLATMVLTPVLLAMGGVITLFFGRLPAPLAHWDLTRPVRSWIVTLVLAVPMLLIAAIAILQAPGSASIMTPAMIIALYLLASTRSALLAPKVDIPASGAT